MENKYIRIELEGIRSSVMTALHEQQDDYEAIVVDCLDKTLSEEWVRYSIQLAVNEVIQSAVSGLGNNWQLKTAVDRALGVALGDMVDNYVKK